MRRTESAYWITDIWMRIYIRCFMWMAKPYGWTVLYPREWRIYGASASTRAKNLLFLFRIFLVKLPAAIAASWWWWYRFWLVCSNINIYEMNRSNRETSALNTHRHFNLVSCHHYFAPVFRMWRAMCDMFDGLLKKNGYWGFKGSRMSLSESYFWEWITGYVEDFRLWFLVFCSNGDDSIQTSPISFVFYVSHFLFVKVFEGLREERRVQQ